jgi:tetratricopeptide (TPR) repeat protein
MSESTEKEVQDEIIENTQSEQKGFFEKLQHLFEEKQQLVTYGGATLLILIGVVVFVFVKWLPDRNKKAQKEMFQAELAFAKDSFNIALNGNGSFKGFVEISKQYSFTPSANLCKCYAGICYLQLKQYDNAIKYLEDFSTSDPIVGAVRLNAIGDAYAELGKIDEAGSYYKKAASFSKNDVYTPYFLFKAALVCEKQKKYSEAQSLLEQIRENYPNSDEGREAEKYLTRVKAAL